MKTLKNSCIPKGYAQDRSEVRWGQGQETSLAPMFEPKVF